jgi:hypothetical protein
MKLSLYELEDLLVKLNVFKVGVVYDDVGDALDTVIQDVSDKIEEAKAAEPPEDQHKLWSCRVHLCTEEFDHIDDAEIHLVEAHGMSFGDDINPSYIRRRLAPCECTACYPPSDYTGPWG